VVSVCSLAAVADETPSDAKPVPRTRGEMKAALEALKQRQPRIPFPSPNAVPTPASGWKANNGTMRRYYLPAKWYAADFAPDPAMKLDNTFKVRLFWIVSRANNCQYCLGHQEHKLLVAGMQENEIAALDSRWDEFPRSEQAAFGFTRKLTLTPHLINADDVAGLRSFYSNDETIELIYVASFYNSVNRWTDGLGIPQDEQFANKPLHLATPTATEYVSNPTIVVEGKDAARPPLEPEADVRRQLELARTRNPRVTIPSLESARQTLTPPLTEQGVASWMRVLSLFPKTGTAQVAALQSIRDEGQLPKELKAKLAAVSARNNRAWASLGWARRRMQSCGIDAAQFESIESVSAELPLKEQVALSFARKLTIQPKGIGDRDLLRLRAHFDDRETAEIVYVVCAANFFDRFTEALNLPLD